MPPYRFVQVDVFTHHPFGGNQLAVFTDARGLSSKQMQMLAREMNYSESTFVLPAETPEAAQRVRIFTPADEMPFAGHPTIGTTYVLASEGVIPLTGPETHAKLQLKIGLMPVTILAPRGEPEFVWMEQRPAEFSETYLSPAALAEALGLEEADLATPRWPLQIVSTGVPYLLVPLRSIDALQRAYPNPSALHQLVISTEMPHPEGYPMFYLFAPPTQSPAPTVRARMFCADFLDLPEDAATGSAAGPLGAYLWQQHLLPAGPLTIEQGQEMGRPSRLQVDLAEAGRIRVGGQTVKVGEGVIYVEEPVSNKVTV